MRQARGLRAAYKGVGWVIVVIGKVAHLMR